MHKKYFIFILCLSLSLVLTAFSLKNVSADIHELTTTEAMCYLNRYADLQQVLGATNVAAAKNHWLEHGYSEGRDYSCSATGLSDAEAQCYLNRYADLGAAFGPTNISAAKTHWLEFGEHEGRNKSCSSSSASSTSSITPLTDVESRCYLDRYPDIVAVLGNTLAAGQAHWISYGYNEGRDKNCQASSNGSQNNTSGGSGAPLSITTASLPKGAFNQSYSAFVNATGGQDGTYSWTIANLPDGLAKTDFRNLTNTVVTGASTVYITGTPNRSGAWNVDFTVTSGGRTANKTLPLVINVSATNNFVCGDGICEKGEQLAGVEGDGGCGSDCSNNCGDAICNEFAATCQADCTVSTECSKNPYDWYVNRYPDVKANGGNPLVHWCLFGVNEKRDSCFTATQCAPVKNKPSCWSDWLSTNCSFF